MHAYESFDAYKLKLIIIILIDFNMDIISVYSCFYNTIHVANIIIILLL